MARTAKRRHEERLWGGSFIPASEIDPLSTTAAVHRKLTRIIENLEPLSKEHGLLKFLKNADRVNSLSGFVQDLVYAITDYQVCIENLPMQIV